MIFKNIKFTLYKIYCRYFKKIYFYDPEENKVFDLRKVLNTKKEN